MPRVSASRRLGGEKPAKRRAITLIELLVVITIMMLLAAYALPKMQPASEQRRIREASRMVSVFMSRAANRAKETGRPCGVMFQLLENPVISPTGGQSRAASNTLFEVEVPPAYAGLSTASRVSFVGYNAATGILRVQETISHDLWSDLISIGDKIQLNNQGPWYTVIGPDLVDNVTGSLPPDGLIDPPTSAPLLQELWLLVEPEHRNRVPSIPAAGVPFTVLRQPSQTIAPPLRLPRGTVVDLGASGTNQQPVQFSSGDGDAMVLFSPNG
ncbi:MAG: type II secretion system protein, partial [Pirellulaceae bacterium]|nr:type II secretion system protein [Pirellulaceae bacterium]